MGELVAGPKGWIETFGELVKFVGQVLAEVWGLRVFKFFGEALRQAGILIVGSPLVIWELLFSLIKAMFEATMIVLVGSYYGYTASGGPVGVGTATAKSMVLNIVGVHLISMLGTQLFWGANPRAPIGG